MPEVPSKKYLAKMVVVFGGAQVFSILAALVRTKVAWQTVGAVGAGMNAVFVAVQQFMQQFMGLGLNQSAMPTLAQAHAAGDAAVVAEKVRSLRILGWIASAAAVVFTMPFAPLFSLLYFDGQGEATMWFMILALGVVGAIQTSVESAVLKGLQQTQALTKSLLWVSVTSVLTAVPCFYFFNLQGVIWAVSLGSVCAWGVTLWYSVRACAVTPKWADFTITNIKKVWEANRAMLVLGAAFVTTGIVTQGFELAQQYFLKAVGSMAIVGFYKAGYQLSVNYPSLIFTAVSNDYYPRLSALVGDVEKRNALIANQQKVLLMITVPAIAVFWVVVPWIIPLIFADECMVILDLVRWGSLSIIIKGLYQPLAYMTLAQGKGKHFFWLDTLSAVVTLASVMAGYMTLGLTGIGVAILVAATVDLVVVYVFCRQKYQFRY